MGRALLYARVSTDEQADNNSLPTQIDACTRYAAQHGLTVAAALQDVMSGAKLDRPGLSKLRTMAANGDIDAVIVYCSDRLTRSLAHSLLLRDEFKTNGVALHFVTKGQTADTPEGGLFENIESAFAEYERLKIRERVVRGKNRVAAEGRVPGDGGHAPYGYIFEGTRKERRMVIHPGTAAIVRRIFEAYTSGEGVAAIQRLLEADKTPTPEDLGTVVGKPRKLAPGTWTRSTLYRMLKNETYVGIFRTRGADVPVPAIIDRETFDAAQQRLATGKARSTRNAQRAYLLRTRVRCAACGNAYHGGTTISHYQGKHEPITYTYRFYRCVGSNKATSVVHHCTSVSVNADALEHAVWHWVANVVLQEDRLREAIAHQQTNVEAERATLDAAKTTLYDQKVQIDREIARFYDRWAAGKMNDDELDAQLAPRKAAITSLEAELGRIGGQIAGMGLGEDGANELLRLTHEIRAFLTSEAGPSYATKQRILDLLDLRVLISQVAGQVYADALVRLTADSGRLIVSQNVYNLVYREEEREMIPLCRDQGLGLIPWSPLARGFLTGNRPKGAEPATVRGRTDTISHALYNEGDDVVVERVGELAAARGVSNAQVALAWLLHTPGITAPIIGASKDYQLEQAVAALELQLDEAELRRLEEPYTPHTVRGHA